MGKKMEALCQKRFEKYGYSNYKILIYGVTYQQNFQS